MHSFSILIKQGGQFPFRNKSELKLSSAFLQIDKDSRYLLRFPFWIHILLLVFKTCWLYTAPCGKRAKWQSERRTSVYRGHSAYQKLKTNPSLNGLTSRFRITVISDGWILNSFWFEINSRFVAFTQSTQFARNKTVTRDPRTERSRKINRLDPGWSVYVFIQSLSELVRDPILDF